MSFPAEGQIVRELGKFLMSGSLYKGAKPVMWSVVEKTALAEAEIEYQEHQSSTIFARFEVTKTSSSNVAKHSSIVIWTTTPWTIPGNRAIAFSAKNKYARIKITEVLEDSLAMIGDEIIIAELLIPQVVEQCGIRKYVAVNVFEGKELAGTICSHPFKDFGYEFDVPLLAADFVEMDTGTGFVHIAPGHGADDWELSIKNDIPVPDTIGGDGLYYENIPIFAGIHVFKADEVVIEKLKDCASLLASDKINHSYPHSWRSKAPLIFRNTQQWFISMDKNQLRDIALGAINDTKFYPETGRKRLY